MDDGAVVVATHALQALEVGQGGSCSQRVEEHINTTRAVEVVIDLFDRGLVGRPSENLNVPMRVSTLSGVVMNGGIGVVIFIFGLVCASAETAHTKRERASRQSHCE